ncbi:hypothetical protein [Microbacterium suwonense]|uniref:Uncharacterized protein n=1 Tax=Microbacterium suwonense TaxID=683047 RepID=A0ABM8FUI8_9MICO|nr:hypothetical protein [Microbacterium suwonense]BDZ39343.1 hypothetical protein GCM10025863_19570 [Microbacterium suwonense]
MKLDDADALLQRVGTIAIMYYPALPADSPEYQLKEDIDWCLDDLAVEEVSSELRELIGRTVVDPTGHREALTAFVYGTVAGAESTE